MSRRAREIVERRSAILASALEVFSRVGLAGARLDQVADHAQVSKTNLLYHFRSKEDLYVEVLRNILEDWLTPLRHLDPTQDPADAIKQYIYDKLVMSRDQPAASRIYCLEMMQGAPLLREQLAGALREVVTEKVAVLQHWIDEKKMIAVSPLHLIFMLWAVTQHYADFAVQIKAVSGGELTEEGFLLIQSITYKMSFSPV